MLWLYILAALLGVAALIFGAVKAKRSGKKQWYILTALGAAAAAAGLVLTALTFILLGGIDRTPPPEESGSSEASSEAIVGQDWRTYRAYSADYRITDELAVCMSPLDDGAGYGVYDAADGARIGTLLPEGTEQFADADEFRTADRNGDGAVDLGVPLKDGGVAWFIYDADSDTWPEPVCGCFPHEVALG